MFVSVARLCVCLVFVFAFAPVASAQEWAGRWASSPAGHLAFVPQDEAGQRTVLQVIDPDGRLAPAEEVARKASDPAVALGPRGDVVVAWTDREHRLWMRYRPAGGTMGAPEQVASGVDTFVESSPIGLDGAGTATFAWVPSTRSFDGGISVRSRAESGAWSAPQNLPGLNVYRPQLAVTGNGSAVLTWVQSKTTRRPNDRQIAISARSPGGVFSAPQIVAGTQRRAGVPVVDANDRGDAAVLWVELHRNTLSVHGSFRAPGGRFGAPVALSRIKDVAGRRVTVMPDGRMILGWTDHETNRLEARTRAPDGTLSPPRVLTNRLELNSSISTLAVGEGAIAWREYNRGTTTVRIAYAAGGRLGQARVIARTRSTIRSEPAFAVTPSGLSMVLKPPERIGDRIRWTRVS